MRILFTLGLLVMLTLATGGHSLAQTSDTGNPPPGATDFTLPTFGGPPTGPCAENRVMPEWFLENQPGVVLKWRQRLREEYYVVKRYEMIVAENSCACEYRYPDPNIWREEIDALVAAFTAEDGSPGTYDGQSIHDISREMSRAKMQLVFQVQDICAQE